jgi:hypothetical protein
MLSRGIVTFGPVTWTEPPVAVAPRITSISATDYIAQTLTADDLIQQSLQAVDYIAQELSAEDSV